MQEMRKTMGMFCRLSLCEVGAHAVRVKAELRNWEHVPIHRNWEGLHQEALQPRSNRSGKPSAISIQPSNSSCFCSPVPLPCWRRNRATACLSGNAGIAPSWVVVRAPTALANRRAFSKTGISCQR